MSDRPVSLDALRARLVGGIAGTGIDACRRTRPRMLQPKLTQKPSNAISFSIPTL